MGVPFCGQVHNAVPFEIQDEITLVWALKDFVLGQWHEITGPIHRSIASYLYAPFYGSYFAYLWFSGAIIGFDEVRESFLLQSAHGYDSINVWVWVPRLVSWLCLVLSIPLQFILTKTVTGNKRIAFIAGILLVFAFTHTFAVAEKLRREDCKTRLAERRIMLAVPSCNQQQERKNRVPDRSRNNYV